MEKLKIAMIGCGGFAVNFVPLFKAHPYVEKVYVCDLIRERAEEFAAKFDVEIIESFEEAITSDKINAVAIFVQRDRHGKLVIEALKHGKHVYSAVPCTIDTEDIFEIESLVRKTRLTYSMGETGFYRAATVFCRREYAKGTFGKFVYGEAQYNHDIRNMEISFARSAGAEWRKAAGIPPMFYPTHSTSMILGSMPGTYAVKVSGWGFKGSPRTDIFGYGDTNSFGNPFSNTAMMLELNNGGIARISENRCLGWTAPETFISQFYGTEGCYEFSVARHSLAIWKPERSPENPMHQDVFMKDVTDQLQPPSVVELIEKDYPAAIQAIADGMGFWEEYPNQPVGRLPKEYEGLKSGHNGTHKFMIDDFCQAAYFGKLSPTNIWQVARFNLPGLIAHQSALEGGKVMDVPDLGNPPQDWEVLDCERTDPFIPPQALFHDTLQ